MFLDVYSGYCPRSWDLHVSSSFETLKSPILAEPWPAFGLRRFVGFVSFSRPRPGVAMKTLLTEETVKVPKGCKITVKSKLLGCSVWMFTGRKGG